MQITGDLVEKSMILLKARMTKTLASKGRKPFIGRLEFLGAAEEEFLELIQAVGHNNQKEVLHELIDLEILAVFESACVRHHLDRAAHTVHDVVLETIYTGLEEDLKTNPRVTFHSIHHILGDVSTEMTKYRMSLVSQVEVAPGVWAEKIAIPFDLARSCFHGIVSVVSGELEW